jgi:hypothetical protein
MDFVSLLSKNEGHPKLSFYATGEDNFNRIFDYGCDAVVKRFEEDFESAFAEK